MDITMERLLRTDQFKEYIASLKDPDDVQTKLDVAVNFLQTKNPEDQLRLLALAANEYTESYGRLRHKWLREETIDTPTFDTSCEREFARVFAKYLS